MRRLFTFTFLLLCAVSAGLYSFVPVLPLSFGSFGVFTPLVTSATAEEDIKMTKIRFVGDIMYARNVEHSMRKYGYAYPLQNLEPHAEDAYLVGNFEGSIPRVHIPTQSMEFSFSIKEEYIASLQEYGFTHLGLANNHSYDFGFDDFKHTNEVLAKMGMLPFGNVLDQASSTIEHIELDGIDIALVGVYAVHARPSWSSMETLITRSEQSSDMQVVYIHWGDEYKQLHNSSQEALAHSLIDMGADVIIGHHPHVVQDIERYKDGIIFYSLGNFIFDQYFSTEVQEGLMVELQPSAENLNFKLLPVTSLGSRSQPRFMPQYEKDLFLEAVAENSDAELDRMIRSGVIVLPL